MNEIYANSQDDEKVIEHSIIFVVFMYVCLSDCLCLYTKLSSSMGAFNACVHRPNVFFSKNLDAHLCQGWTNSMLIRCENDIQSQIKIHHFQLCYVICWTNWIECLSNTTVSIDNHFVTSVDDDRWSNDEFFFVCSFMNIDSTKNSQLSSMRYSKDFISFFYLCMSHSIGIDIV